MLNQLEPTLCNNPNSNNNNSNGNRQQHCFLSSFHNKNNAATLKYSEKNANINSLTVGTKFPLLEDRMKPTILTSDVSAANNNHSFLHPCEVQLSGGSHSSSSGCDVMDSSYTSSPCSVSSMVSSEFTNATDTTRTTMSRTYGQHASNQSSNQKSAAYMTGGTSSIKVLGNTPNTTRYATARMIGSGGDLSPNDGTGTNFRSSVV
jgi:hypothetical protein